MPQHQRDNQIVIERAVRFVRQSESTDPVPLGQGNRNHSRQNNQKRKQHFRHGGDQRRPARGGHRFRRHRPLDHEEIGAPITEREHESEPHEHGEPLDPHRIIGRASHETPGVGESAGRVMLRRRHFVQASLQSAPAANVAQSEKDKRDKPGDDEKELHHLVVDRRGQAA